VFELHDHLECFTRFYRLHRDRSLHEIPFRPLYRENLTALPEWAVRRASPVHFQQGNQGRHVSGAGEYGEVLAPVEICCAGH
jgi:hypothetical protein